MKIPLYIPKHQALITPRQTTFMFYQFCLRYHVLQSIGKGKNKETEKKYTYIQHYNKTMCHAFRSSLGKTVPRKMLPFSENPNLNWQLIFTNKFIIKFQILREHKKYLANILKKTSDSAVDKFMSACNALYHWQNEKDYNNLYELFS